MALVEHQSVPPSIGVEPRWEAVHRGVCDRLTARYGNGIDQAVIEVVVARHFETYVDARITLYVPVLVERAAADELRRLTGRLTNSSGRIPRP